jgi:hypothetical protein
MEDRLGALGLELNAIVYWNGPYIDAAVKKLAAGSEGLGEMADPADLVTALFQVGCSNVPSPGPSSARTAGRKMAPSSPWSASRRSGCRPS